MNERIISRNLLYLRRINNLTQEEMSKILGVSYGAIAHYEHGRREPDILSLVKLSEYFNVSVGDLLTVDLSLNPEFLKAQQLRNKIISIIGSMDYESLVKLLKLIEIMR